MKVIILCGGKGTRLREETEYRPKPMVEIGGRPIIWHIMKHYSYYGHKDFILCMGYKQSYIRDYFLNYHYMNNDVTCNLATNDLTVHNNHKEDWTVTLVDTGLETPKGGRMLQIRKYLDEGEDFLMTYGDGVSNININTSIEHHKKSGALATFSGVHPISRFATVEMDAQGKIIDWDEKKQLEGYINGGFYIINEKALDFIDGEVEFEEQPMKDMAQAGKVSMYKHDGFWQCMDTYRDYQILENLYQKRKAPWIVWNE